MADDASTGSGQSTQLAQLPDGTQIVEAPVLVLPSPAAPQAHPPPPVTPPPPPPTMNLNTYLLLTIIGLILGFLAFWMGSMLR